MITFKVEGLKELEDKLKQIEPKVAKKIVRRAHAIATRRYIKVARAHLKNKTGLRGRMDLRNLRMSIKSSKPSGPRRGAGGPFVVEKQIGPHRDSSVPYGPKDVFYAGWFEWGVDPHETGIRGQHPGLEGLQYMTKTAAQLRLPSTDILRREVAKGLADISKGGR